MQGHEFELWYRKRKKGKKNIMYCFCVKDTRIHRSGLRSTMGHSTIIYFLNHFYREFPWPVGEEGRHSRRVPVQTLPVGVFA